MIFKKEQKGENKSTAVDMTEGFIPKQLLYFCVPLILGNFFQVLYNTVDTMVVGNFVGKEALAAVGSTNPIINIAVFCFNGISVGAGVVIGQYFGAKELKKLHVSVETTMAMTFIASILFTIAGVCLTPAMLRLISTPDDVMPAATIYLQIYFAGISGLLVYNMGSGILRAVGDSKRPLYFLILSSFLNIGLDLLFVLVFGMGIAGASIATIISQFISAALVLILLSRSEDIYKLTWQDMGIDMPTLRKILAIGLPAGLQSMITAFSNSFVQAYINSFGSVVMAGWSCYNKLDQVIMLPQQSMAHATTTFVSQNIGAGKVRRAEQGTVIAVSMMVFLNMACGLIMIAASRPLVELFTNETEVIESGIRFIKAIALFFWFNGINHSLAGSMRGRGDSKGPMIIMIICFVGVRQLYLYIITHIVTGNPMVIGLGYPVGWASCCVVELIYYKVRHLKGKRDNNAVMQ